MNLHEITWRWILGIPPKAVEGTFMNPVQGARGAPCTGFMNVPSTAFGGIPKIHLQVISCKFIIRSLHQWQSHRLTSCQIDIRDVLASVELGTSGVQSGDWHTSCFLGGN